MGKRKQTAFEVEKKEKFELKKDKTTKSKNQKNHKRQSILFIIITTILSILDIYFINSMSNFLSNSVADKSTSTLESYGINVLAVFCEILFLGILNGVVIILIIILLKRFFKEE